MKGKASMNKSKNMTIRISPEVRTKLQENSSNLKMSISDYIEFCCVTHAPKIKVKRV